MEDSQLKKILQSMRCVACVGLSANPVRPSYFVGRYLSLKGKTVIGVNPGTAGQRLFGQEIRANLQDIPQDLVVDTVDIFRRSESVPGIVEDALEHLPHLRTVWMQIGVMHEEAAERARNAGLQVVQNRCPKIEYQRLFGELRMGGFNTGVISSRL